MAFKVGNSAYCLLLGIALSGCSEQVGPVGEVIEVVPASGIVTFQGKPLEGFQVTFMPVSGDRPSIGISDATGKFVLGTNGTGDRDGAVVGANKVAVVWSAPELADDTTASAIDDPSKMPKPPVAIPAKYHNPETSGITMEVPASGTSELKIDLQ
jgi:hypothetical protein